MVTQITSTLKLLGSYGMPAPSSLGTLSSSWSCMLLLPTWQRPRIREVRGNAQLQANIDQQGLHCVKLLLLLLELLLVV